MNVYEWERRGSGSCPAQQQAGGCLYLISTGVSEEPSYFAEAGESGSDVFLFTRQSLVAQDEDALMDVYDVRVDGGIAAQNTVASTTECSQENCHPPQPPPTEVGPPVSQTFNGAGNLAPQPQPAPASAKAKPKKAAKHKPKKRKRKRRGHGKQAGRTSRRAARHAHARPAGRPINQRPALRHELSL